MTRQIQVILPILLVCAGPIAAQRIDPEVWGRGDSATARLSPDAFPTLPAPIRHHLRDRGCLIPQSPEASGLHNVDSGHLRDPRQVDWIALCSIDRVSRILVYWAGDTLRVDSLPPSADRNYLQGMGEDVVVFSHVIGVVSARYIREHAERNDGPLPPSPIHDGIDNAFAGKGSTVLYWSGGRWLELAGAD